MSDATVVPGRTIERIIGEDFSGASENNGTSVFKSDVKQRPRKSSLVRDLTECKVTDLRHTVWFETFSFEIK